MKKSVLFICIAALAMLAVSGQGFAAYNQVSIQFTENPGNQAFSGGQFIGPFSTNSSNWNSSNFPTTGDKVAGTIVDLIDATGTPTGIDIEWASSNTWYNGDGTSDDQHKLTVGYLDDSDPNATGKGVSITLTNIPYANYQIVGLYSSGQGDTAMVNYDVNGTWVLGGDATTIADVYGSINSCNSNTGSYWAMIEPGVTRGNYWVADATGATCTITGELRNGTSRGSLAGLIILTEEIIPAPQRSISTNYQYEASVGGWGYHFYLVNSSNDAYGYNDPNGLYGIGQTPSATWNEGRYITDTYLAKDYTGSTGSAIAIHSGDNVWDSSWYLNVDNYFNGSPIADLDPNDPFIVEDARNKARVSQAFLVQNGADPKEALTTLNRVPYGQYTVVTYMHPNHFDSLDEIQIEDQTRFYRSQDGGGAYGETWTTDTTPDGFKWNVARDISGQGGWLVASPAWDDTTAERANVAIFQGLTSPDMVLYFDAHGSNSGISAYSLISEVDADEVVTQITPGNINKDYGDTPAAVDSTLTWNPPVNGAPDSYDVYFGEYGGDDPNLYLVQQDTATEYVPTLDYGKSYVWRVDSVTGGVPTTGDLFYFDVEGDPVIMVQPRSVSVEEGTDTFFDVDALVMGPEFGGVYTWYYSPDDTTATPEDDILLKQDSEDNGGNVVDILNVAPADLGYYYVVLTNTIPGTNPVVSETASLEIGILELYVPFDGDWEDYSGNGWEILPGNRIVDVNGIYQGPSAGTISYGDGFDGEPNAAAIFTRGSSDQLEVIASDDYFNFYPKGFTVRFWVKPTYGQGGFLTYMGKSTNSWNPPQKGWRMFDQAEFYSQGYSANIAPTSYNTPQGRLDDGNWHFLACTYDGATQEMKVYQNGVLQNTLTVEPVGTTDLYPLVIGNQYKDGGGGWGYNGLMDEVEIFSYAVSEYDMLEHYAIATGQVLCESFGEPPIVGDANGDCKVDLLDSAAIGQAWLDSSDPGTMPAVKVVSWQFDQTSGLTAIDSSGNGIDGALGDGFPVDDSQWLIDGGRTGNTGDHALYFNGGLDTAVIADANAITLPFANGAGNIFEGTASWTINLWIKYASEEAADAMTNIGGFGYNEWLDPSTNTDRYFASYSGGYEFEVGQDGIWPSTPLTAEWQMMTATYDGTTCTVYYDGQQVSQADVALINAAEEINLNTARRVLWAGVEETVPLTGLIDDFCIWSEALDADQVTALYYGCDGLVLPQDLDKDCDVDFDDLLIVMNDWLECQRVPTSECF